MRTQRACHRGQGVGASRMHAPGRLEPHWWLDKHVMRYSVINLFVSDLLNANFSFSEYHGYHQQHTDSLPARQHGFYISLCSTAVLIPPLSLSLGPLVISLFVSLSSFSRFFYVFTFCSWFLFCYFFRVLFVSCRPVT